MLDQYCFLRPSETIGEYWYCRPVFSLGWGFHFFEAPPALLSWPHRPKLYRYQLHPPHRMYHRQSNHCPLQQTTRYPPSPKKSKMMTTTSLHQPQWQELKSEWTAKTPSFGVYPRSLASLLGALCSCPFSRPVGLPLFITHCRPQIC